MGGLKEQTIYINCILFLIQDKIDYNFGEIFYCIFLIIENRNYIIQKHHHVTGFSYNIYHVIES